MTRLKWHRARRTASDTPFTATRIIEAMTLGASVEVDLILHRDGGYAILHDRDLDAATTGCGPVVAHSAAQLRALCLRDNNGEPRDDERVLLLEDLAEVLADVPIHRDALLQLDFKEDASALDPTTINAFAHSVAPFAANAILSCGDAEAVTILTDAVPAIRVGYDPCHGGAIERVLRSGDFAGFVEQAVAASPRAEMIYLDRHLILAAADQGADLVAMFHDAGRSIDAYTVSRLDDDALPDVARLLELGVDQITTDDPAGFAARFGSVAL